MSHAPQAKSDALSIASYLKGCEAMKTKDEIIKYLRITGMNPARWSRAMKCGRECGLIVSTRYSESVVQFHADYETRFLLEIDQFNKSKYQNELAKQRSLYRETKAAREAEKAEIERLKKETGKKFVPLYAAKESRFVKQRFLPCGGHVRWFKCDGLAA